MTSKTILIADDDHDLVEALAMRCRSLGIAVHVARDATAALTSIRQHRPDLVCLDVNMPAGNGLSVCEMMAGHQELSSIPVIMLTGRTDEECVRRCHSMCAYYVLKSRDIWRRMEPLIRELLDIRRPSGAPEAPAQAARSPVKLNRPSRRPDNLPRTLPRQVSRESAGDCEKPHRPTVLYVEDDIDQSRAMKMRLEAMAINVIQAFNGMEGYRLAFTNEPDVILCDFGMPEGDGDYLSRRLRENPLTENIPVIFLTGRQGHDLERRMYGQGAAGFLTKPANMDELLRELGRFIRIDNCLGLGTATASTDRKLRFDEQKDCTKLHPVLIDCS